jgi:hypothetical protein
MVADEQWNQQFTNEPPVRPVGELAQHRVLPSKTQLRPLPDVHQLRSARITYEGNITSKRKN